MLSSLLWGMGIPLISRRVCEPILGTLLLLELPLDARTALAHVFLFFAKGSPHNNFYLSSNLCYETIINLISTTTTRTGLRVRAKLDPRVYQSGLVISDDDMKHLRLPPHHFHPEWNYTIASG
jgi:Rhodopirellula transposase DDE domain